MYDYKDIALEYITTLVTNVEEFRGLKEDYNQYMEVLDVKNTSGLESIKEQLRRKVGNAIGEIVHDLDN